MLIPFKVSTNDKGNRTYSTPWNTIFYEAYSNAVHHGDVVIVDLFSNGATLAKSGTKSVTFMRVRFFNIGYFFDKCFTVSVAPTPKVINLSLPKEKKTKLELQLFPHFIFLTLENLIRASFTGTVVNWIFLLPHVAMVIADQP